MAEQDVNPGALALPRRERARAWLRDFLPARMAVDARERWRVVAGAALGLLFTALLSHWLTQNIAGVPWLIAPLGASAVLVFGVPAARWRSPGRWSAATRCRRWWASSACKLFGVGPWVAGLAVGLAIARCSAALPAPARRRQCVAGGAHRRARAAIRTRAGAAQLGAAGGRRHRLQQRHAALPARPAARGPAPVAGKAPQPGFAEADLDAVLARYNQVLDLSRDDLQTCSAQAELDAYRRKLGEVRCADIMSRDVTTEFGTSLQDAWALLRERRIKACRWSTACHAWWASSRSLTSCAAPTSTGIKAGRERLRAS
jgi:CBS domain-containing membrane protein